MLSNPDKFNCFILLINYIGEIGRFGTKEVFKDRGK